VSSINRNLAIYGNLIIDTSADDYVYGLDAQTGALVWEHKILDYQKGAQQTSGPIIAKGKIISGRGCEPEGGPDACIITAHDAKGGEELWRTRTIPRDDEAGGDTWGDVPYEERLHVGSRSRETCIVAARAYARDRYSPVSVLTRMVSPVLTKGGTFTTRPVSVVAGLIWLLAVAPLMPGEVSVTFRSTVGGSSMPTGSVP
jgi:hypothetical protein